MAQTQRPDLVILHRSVHGRHRISSVELTCPWDTDADKARDRKISRYAGLKEELSHQGWDFGLYTIEVGAHGHISKVVKDGLRSSVFIPVLGPSRAQIWCRADDQVIC
jgi:hypothetical protein